MIKNVRFGADPEFFISLPHSYALVSAVGKIGGTKQAPKPLDDGGYMVQEDNVAVEFNIPPVQTPEEFQAAIEHSLKLIMKEIQGKYVPVFDAARLFPDAELQTDQARTFGCEPDYNAWMMCENPVPNLSGTEWANLRTAGGHLHVSWDNPNIDDQIQLVRALDVFAGVPFAMKEPINMRSKLYGKEGAFRFKDYGIEYRTLSNYWLTLPNLSAKLIEMANKAIEYINSGKVIDEADHELVKTAICEQNTFKCYDVIKKYKVYNPL